MGVEGYLPLFETEELKGRIAYRLYALSVLVCISLFLAYRVTHFPGKEEDGRWAWIGMFGAELWFSLYWMINQSARWKPVIRRTFKDRLSQKYENELPGVDIFVCTADPKIEPPAMVINTVLSVMAYDYPPEKLSVYLSDDGGSDLTFYALLEASRFSKHWLPFCKKFKVEPRAPAAYFSTATDPLNPVEAEEFWSIKKLYKDMENRVEIVTTQGEITEEMRKAHKGFLEWVLDSNPRDHQTILQILIDGRDHNFVDMEGKQLPTLVYMAREKRPNYHHNFKAGAMNALIRVSSQISNGEIILNVDCDMYSNNSESIRDALCFFMDEEKGNEIAFVQYPQVFNNNTKNDIYGSLIRIGIELELHGLDGYGGPLYVGTGCFHRREALCGRKYNKEYKRDWKRENTKKMGLVYGCPVEDVVTGLTIKCRGWRAIYFNPARRSFLGLAPTTLAQALLQHKRWCEGHFKIVFSKHYSLWQGHGRIKAGLQIGYCIYNMWGFNCIPTLCYIIIPSLCLLQGIVLFPSAVVGWKSDSVSAEPIPTAIIALYWEYLPMK